MIELLIVVAIIAILAAIAIPNFLEAQTRSKVARVQADLRTMATGLEAYFIDFNSYVNDSDNSLGQDGQGGLALLTSPIPYLTSLPIDVFQSHESPRGDQGSNQGPARHFELGSGADNEGWSGRFGSYGPQGAPRQQSWLNISVGPDGEDDTHRNDQWPGNPRGDATYLRSYDPTNGSISDGDVYKAGGMRHIGNYYVDGRHFGELP